GACGALPDDGRQAAPESGRIFLARRFADSADTGKLCLSFLREAVYLTHEIGGACGARDVRVLRRGGLLPGNGRRDLLENSEHALGRFGFFEDVYHGWRGCAERRGSVRRCLRIAER